MEENAGKDWAAAEHTRGNVMVRRIHHSFVLFESRSSSFGEIRPQARHGVAVFDDLPGLWQAGWLWQSFDAPSNGE